MKKLLLILTLFLLFINTVFAAGQKYAISEYKVPSIDGFNIVAELKYPKIKGQNEYKTVVLLHSLGYNSEWWDALPDDLLAQGYAVLKIDLRGHGKSVYNTRLARTSWKSMTNNAYAKYPKDVISVIEHVKRENKRKFFNDWAIVGADIGASTGIYVANELSYKPKTMVMLSPTINGKGIYVPVKFAELGGIDVLSIVGTGDNFSLSAQNYLLKFAQAGFATYTSESKSTGQLMLKNDKSLSMIIVKWIKQYLQ